MEFTQNHEEIIIIRNESVTVTTINFNSVEILKIDKPFRITGSEAPLLLI